MDWKSLFKTHILERALDYYENGLVKNYEKGTGFVQATVQGSSDYDVYADIIDRKIIDMECECPYALDGNHCKHMAALLFCMESGTIGAVEGKENVSKRAAGKLSPDFKNNLKELVGNAEGTLVRDFLTEILEKDEKLLSRFKSILGCEITAEDMKRYKNQIRSIFDKYAGKQRYINYQSARSFVFELENFLDNDIESMLENRQYREAFELTGYVFVETGNQDMDDSDGGTGMLAERCMEIWRNILEYNDIDLKRFMFLWFEKHLDGRIIDYMEEYIEQIMFEDFQEDQFLMQKLEFTRRKVCEYRNEKDSWSRGYHAGKWALRHIAVMEELKTSWDKIEGYAIENLEFSSVREYYVQDCIKKEKYETAIQTLEEGKKTDKNAAGLVAGYSEKLKELYKQTGRSEDYEKELWNLMLKYKSGDIAVYKELKTLYTEEVWIRKREKIFEKISPHTAIDKLYKEDQLYDRLLNFVLNSNGLYKLKEYEKYLINLYPEELLMKYEKVVTSMAAHTADRKHYHELVDILIRMQKYPEGKKRVNEIVCSWRSKYRNRPAMMDELNRI